MTAAAITPQVGLRFELHGAEFEVAFVARGMVRYAATAGGRQYKMPLADFAELVRCNKIEVKSESVRRTVPAHNASRMVRKHRYVEAVLGLWVSGEASGSLSRLFRSIERTLASDVAPI